jgi:thiamine-phosphate pyrophosphorylase
VARCALLAAPGVETEGDVAIAPMWFFTDPARTPDVYRIAEQLPPGSGVVYRGFGRKAARDEALRLSDIAQERGLCLLIGQDAELAERVGADGVHLPERRLGEARDLRRRHPKWLMTGAAHDVRAVRRAENAGCDAIFISAVFPSHSPSASRPIGPFRLAALAARTSRPVLALGGVQARSARRLLGVSGFAAVDAFRT